MTWMTLNNMHLSSTAIYSTLCSFLSDLNRSFNPLPNIVPYFLPVQMAYLVHDACATSTMTARALCGVELAHLVEKLLALATLDIPLGPNYLGRCGRCRCCLVWHIDGAFCFWPIKAR